MIDTLQAARRKAVTAFHNMRRRLGIPLRGLLSNKLRRNTLKLYEQYAQDEKPVCALCCEGLKLGDASVDHLTPLHRGGSGVDSENLALVHQRCNVIKGLLRYEEYAQLATLVETWPPEARRDIWRRLYAGGRRFR